MLMYLQYLLGCLRCVLAHAMLLHSLESTDEMDEDALIVQEEINNMKAGDFFHTLYCILLPVALSVLLPECLSVYMLQFSRLLLFFFPPSH